MEVSDMLTVSSLIDFLMNLLRDEAAQAEFERDPQGTLAKAGLDNLCGQDVRDVYPMLADHPAVHAKAGAAASAHSSMGAHHGGLHGGHDDPVRAINYVTEHHEVHETVVHESPTYNVSYIDDRDTITNVDDRDTTSIHADGDVTVKDSFNQDNDVNVVQDSFNQDNDGIDNKGGTIDHSVAAGDDIHDSLNSHHDTTVDDSFNTDNSHTAVDASHDTTTHTGLDDSFNTDNDGTDIDSGEHALPEAEHAA
jgi:hypothetical protein